MLSAEKTEKTVGKLERAHIKASSKRGRVEIPMCPTCHAKYDDGKLTDTQLKKLGLTREQYNCIRPKPGPKRGTTKPGDLRLI